MMLIVLEKKREKLLLFFFFSSRRRHTRSLRDWSSDVCSSDLGEGQAQVPEAVRQHDNADERGCDGRGVAALPQCLRKAETRRDRASLLPDPAFVSGKES